jgi:hypothetical protein
MSWLCSRAESLVPACVGSGLLLFFYAGCPAVPVPMFCSFTLLSWLLLLLLLIPFLLYRLCVCVYSRLAIEKALASSNQSGGVTTALGRRALTCIGAYTGAGPGPHHAFPSSSLSPSPLLPPAPWRSSRAVLGVLLCVSLAACDRPVGAMYKEGAPAPISTQLPPGRPASASDLTQHVRGGGFRVPLSMSRARYVRSMPSTPPPSPLFLPAHTR